MNVTSFPPLGDLKVEPNPVQEGGTVTISGDKNGVVYILVPGKAGRTKVQLDKDGKAKVVAPVRGGQEFIVSPMTTDGKEVVVEVVSGTPSSDSRGT
ncbi:MAG: hypothetical protein H6837_20640 [Planctomycetes bacterium]|nr:hypothetical protein [Planctomycetota bacterium]